ncbi:hypothetical protein SCLARK_00463 [Spiroplasma clarkii]|nr:hypothetical protein SCLARK_00463 [Spiroplasma clarkii]
MDLLDKMPNLLSILNKLIPDKIQKLRKNYLIESNQEDIKYAFERISELSFYAQEQSILIMQMLSKLQFITAEQQIIEVLKEINSVEDALENGDKLRDFFETNLPVLDKSIGEVTVVIEKLEKLFNEANKFDKTTLTQPQQLLTLKENWEKTAILGRKVCEIFQITRLN